MRIKRYCLEELKSQPRFEGEVKKRKGDRFVKLSILSGGHTWLEGWHRSGHICEIFIIKSDLVLLRRNESQREAGGAWEGQVRPAVTESLVVFFL